MAKRVLVILGHGFEETEYVATRDALIRCGLDVDSVSLEDTVDVRSNHNLTIKADMLFENVNTIDYDAVFIPGGPGTQALGEKESFDIILNDFVDSKRVIAAICAAPTLLAKRGLLEGKDAVCYPDEELINMLIVGKANYHKDTDYISSGRFFTGKNMQVSVAYGYALAEFIENNK